MAYGLTPSQIFEGLHACGRLKVEINFESDVIKSHFDKVGYDVRLRCHRCDKITMHTVASGFCQELKQCHECRDVESIRDPSGRQYYVDICDISLEAEATLVIED